MTRLSARLAVVVVALAVVAAGCSKDEALAYMRAAHPDQTCVAVDVPVSSDFPDGFYVECWPS